MQRVIWGNGYFPSMKNLILCLSMLMGTTMTLPAQWTQDDIDHNGPEIRFEQEVIDYGTIEQGADGMRRFKFTNTGNEPLIISHAMGSCGCLVPSWPIDPILPGESGEIKVRYDTQRIGRFSKSVTLTSNCEGSMITLRVKGRVKTAAGPKNTPKDE